MPANNINPIESVSSRLSDLYIALEDFTEEGSTGSLLKMLALLQDLCLAIGHFDGTAVAALRPHDVSWSEITSSLGGSRKDVNAFGRPRENSERPNGSLLVC